MGQFAFIFVQSVLAYFEGPECGSPDFSKLLMMGYMGSMLVLFSDFFIKRYILKKQAYDMCSASAPTPFPAFFSRCWDTGILPVLQYVITLASHNDPDVSCHC